MLKSISGRYGEEHVLRVLSGKTILARRPKRSGKMTPKQLAHQERFLAAIKYGTFIKDDPAMWEKYEINKLPGLSAFNMAVADFLSAPVIMQIDTDGYTGLQGEKIIVTATDKIEVTGVTVAINAPDGTLVEEGVASRRQGTSFYAYFTTRENPGKAGTVITVTATDNPGHTGVASVTL